MSNDEIILKLKIGLALVFHLIGFCLFLWATVVEAAQGDIPLTILAIFLMWIAGHPIPKFLTPLGQIRLTKEGIGYYSWFMNTKEFHRWSEIHSFELRIITGRGGTHKSLNIFLKDDFRMRTLTQLQILGTSLEELESYLNQRLE